jgi:hypothetical protein
MPSDFPKHNPAVDFTYSEGCGCKVTFFGKSLNHTSRIICCDEHAALYAKQKKDLGFGATPTFWDELRARAKKHLAEMTDPNARPMWVSEAALDIVENLRNWIPQAEQQAQIEQCQEAEDSFLLGKIEQAIMEQWVDNAAPEGTLRKLLGNLDVDAVCSDHMHDICLANPPAHAGNPVMVGNVNSVEGVMTDKQAERFARELVACWNNSGR